MALNPSTNATMAGRITAVDANYPYGSTKDETSLNAGDGTPYFKARGDDIFGFQQALLTAAGIVPNGNADTVLNSQYLQSCVALSSGLANSVTDSGAADAYVLSLPSVVLPPPAFFDGLTVSFFASADNTTTTPTADAFGLGAKTIVKEDGSALVAGDISTTVMTVLRRDNANDRWILIRGAGTQSSGILVQSPVVSTFTSPLTITNPIPLDNTIPQNTEGAEITTATITPKDASNILEIEAVSWGAGSTANMTLCGALFKDSVADAFAAKAIGVVLTANASSNWIVKAYVMAGTTSPITFKFRAGPDFATMYVNSSTGSGQFGGVETTTLTIKEFRP